MVRVGSSVLLKNLSLYFWYLSALVFYLELCSSRVNQMQCTTTFLNFKNTKVHQRILIIYMLQFLNSVLIIPMFNLIWCLLSKNVKLKMKKVLRENIFPNQSDAKNFRVPMCQVMAICFACYIFLAVQNTLICSSDLQMMHSFGFLCFISL